MPESGWGRLGVICQRGWRCWARKPPAGFRRCVSPDCLNWIFHVLRADEDAFRMGAGGGGAKANVLLGAQVYTILLGGIMIIAGVALFTLIRERYYEKLVVNRKQGQVSIKETLWQTLAMPAFPRRKSPWPLAYGMGTSMVAHAGLLCDDLLCLPGRRRGGQLVEFLDGAFRAWCSDFQAFRCIRFVARWLGKKRRRWWCVQLVRPSLCLSGTWWLYTPVHSLVAGFRVGPDRVYQRGILDALWLDDR